MTTVGEALIAVVGTGVIRALYGVMKKQPAQEIVKSSFEWGIVTGGSILLITKITKDLAKG